MLRFVPLTLALCLVAGCGGRDSAETAASMGASMLERYRAGLHEYVVAASETNSQHAQWINRVQQEARETRGDTALLTTAWDLSRNTRASAMLKTLTGVSSDDILSTSPELASLQPVTIQALPDVDTKGFDSVLRSLKKLETAPTLADETKALFQYGSDVADSYKKSLNKASSAQQDSAAQINENTKAATPKAQNATKPYGRQ